MLWVHSALSEKGEIILGRQLKFHREGGILEEGKMNEILPISLLETGSITVIDSYSIMNVKNIILQKTRNHNSTLCNVDFICFGQECTVLG